MRSEEHSSPSLVFPDTLETIGENAFIPYLYNGYWYNNEIPSLIQKITFGANLKTIGSHAFYSNKVLSEIIFTGDKLKSIGESAFSGCTALTSLNITGDYAEICGGAFYGCSKLESVTLSGVETLGNNGAFEWCTNLKTFTADSTLINIGKVRLNTMHFLKRSFGNQAPAPVRSALMLFPSVELCNQS